MKLQLLNNGFKLKVYGRRVKVPIRVIYACISLVVPFIPIILIGLVPKIVYIHKHEVL